MASSADETGRTLGWKVMLGTARHFSERGETEKAEEYYKRALEAASVRLGDSDPTVVSILVEFAGFYRILGKAAYAEVLDTRAKNLDSMEAAEITREALADLS